MNREFAEEVFRVRQRHPSVFRSRRRINLFVEDLIELLFPHLSGESEYYSAAEIEGRLAVLGRDLKVLLQAQQGQMKLGVDEVVEGFFGALPQIYDRLWLDAQAIHEGDPASESLDEVISAYPGFFAIYTQRIAHELYNSGVPILPRMLTEYAHIRTGVDIHPGATIGNRFCIDHGTGIVIGEKTAPDGRGQRRNLRQRGDPRRKDGDRTRQRHRRQCLADRERPAALGRLSLEQGHGSQQEARRRSDRFPDLR
jgi:serine O-acetyltransferase